MYLQHDGIQLRAKLELPENKQETHPLVIVVHGLTGHMEERHITAVSRTMNALGFATLRVELYGHGKSGGEFRDHSLTKWVEELVYVIDTVRQLEFTTTLYLCGHSQGGLAVMLAAALRQTELSGLIALSPAWTIPDGVRAGNLLGIHFDATQLPDEVTLKNGQTLGGGYLSDARSIDAEAAIHAYKGPVLIVHGTQDATVPFACSEQAAKRYAHATLVPVADDTHCFDRHLNQMTEAVRAWLSDQLSIIR